MHKLFKLSFLLVAMLMFSSHGFAVDNSSPLPSLNNMLFADSDGCRACIRDVGCDIENKSCESMCRSTLFTSSEDAVDCRTSCAAKWSQCEAKARSSCSYYCKSDS